VSAESFEGGYRRKRWQGGAFIAEEVGCVDISVFEAAR
jgi:hypothetical protein